MSRGLMGLARSKPVIIGIILIAAAWSGKQAFMWFMGFGGGPPAGGAMVIPVEGTTVKRGDVAERLTVVGQVEAFYGTEIKTEIAGKVVAVGAKDGDEVAAGDVLFQLDDSVLRAQLAQAEANLQLAINTQHRNQRLVKAGAVSKQQTESAAAEASLARANVQLAKASLDKAFIRAPFAGRLGVGRVNVGNYVTPGTLLTTVTDASKVKVLFDIPEKYAGLQVGAAAVLDVDHVDGALKIAALLTAVDGKVDPATRTVDARVDVDNTNGVLVPGQFVRVTVDTRLSANTLMVPDMALVPQGNKMFVFAVNPGQPAMASRTEVQIGLREQNFAEVLGGLKEGQVVVTAGQQKLQAPVMPVTVSSPSAITVLPSPIENLNN